MPPSKWSGGDGRYCGETQPAKPCFRAPGQFGWEPPLNSCSGNDGATNGLQGRFVLRAIRRKRLFLGLSSAGIVIAFTLTVLYGILWWRNPALPIAPRAVIVLLVLLNARQNLRQYKYARVLEGFVGKRAR